MTAKSKKKLIDSYITTKMVPLGDLVDNPLNSNVMSEDMLEKLKVNIRRTGNYPVIITRLHPDRPGKLQILDGHHRVKALRTLGHATVRCDIWDVPLDREAKILLASLNSLHGQESLIKRAQLIHELLGEMSVDDLAGLLPESDKQLEELHALLQFPAEEIAAQLEAEAEESERVLPRVMSFVVSPEQETLIETAVEAASDGTAGRDRKARGLANLARRFMENRDEPAA